MKDHTLISRIHYITQDMPDVSHMELALEACSAGVDLVQLRLKGRKRSEMLEMAWEVKKICAYYGATFIINDHLDIALNVDADGIHLGNGDTGHQLARKVLGPEKIIGGTAYTQQEALWHKSRGIVDYIGLGTFRKTRTKPEITEFLSLEEIGRLVDHMERMDGPRIPLLVIGGVRIDDIPSLLSVGVHGIAIASLINESPDKARTYADVLRAFS
ncbi:thiamine phosphate synthase [Muricauda sp. NFXS6]|uniref:thiamine phosphate synthase n=1 Tax=Allomuricauda sp. NFXS6 TaxID=2819094 RepID=UPI0032DEEA95